MSNDRINIKNLEIFARHGVFPEENALGQKFIISAVLTTDFSGAALTDDLNKSIDYGGVCHVIKNYVEGNVFKLIETVADGLARELLIEYPALQKVQIEVKKPWAPVMLHLETVSVEAERERHTAYIALGSNLGDRAAYLNFAVKELEKTRECRVLRVSEFISSEPYGYTEQDEFLNGCLALETLLNPYELLDLLHGIEDLAGRERKVRWGPRTLDLDIIFYDDIVMSTDKLRIPHAEMHKRDFVLIPLNDVAPNMLHPILMKTTAELLDNLKSEN